MYTGLSTISSAIHDYDKFRVLSPFNITEVFQAHNSTQL